MKAGPTCKTILFTALFESEHILYQNEVTYSKRGCKLRPRLFTLIASPLMHYRSIPCLTVFKAY